MKQKPQAGDLFEKAYHPFANGTTSDVRSAHQLWSSIGRSIKHAQILLKSEQGWSDKQIMQAYGVGETTIWRVRTRFLEHGLDDALKRRPQAERPEKRRLTGEDEAHLIALACTQAPKGYERWSIRLLTKTALELEIVSQVGRETVRQVLKKMSSNRG